MSSKKKELLSDAMKRTSEWIFSQEIPSDVTIYVGGVSFSLHKFPLVSKSGYIRRLVSESAVPDLSEIRLQEIPGGAEAFELAAKFCYGINFEIGTDNIASLRCVAEYLEMTEDYAVGNLVTRTEAYFNEVALKSIAGVVTVLNASVTLLPLSEEVKLMSRCIDAIAFIACKESQCGQATNLSTISQPPKANIVDWWAEDLTFLRIDIFQRVVNAMIGRGFKHYALAPVLMLYAQKSLRGLEVSGKWKKKSEVRQEHEKRVVLETIVSLLPRERNAMSVSFLSTLLRSAIYLETTIACRLDLEKRMALQLGEAALDDLLIPSYPFTDDMLFDVDTVQRIMMNYLELEIERNPLGYHVGVEDEQFLLPPSDMERVGKLMENYLSEIATDRNLSVAKFIGLAELIPEKSRIAEDGMYRAIDIYLKAHPSLSDMERKKVCSLMDCQKLSREACAHAAQNDRLPAQTVVQVLYYEQQRLRDSMHSSFNSDEQRMKVYSTGIGPVSDELSALRRENQDLKLELVKMKMKLKEIEKSTPTRSFLGSPLPSAHKPPLPRKSFINSVSKKLGRINPFIRGEGIFPSSAKSRSKPPKDRRHSIS